MILVTGATGQFGSRAVDHLLGKGINPLVVSVLVRDITTANHLKDKGIKVKIGDYNEYDSMVEAFSGVDKLLLVSSNNREAIENRTRHHKNAIKAAKKAEVNHIIYTSFVRNTGFENSAISDFQNSHVETERYLKESGVTYTILQNAIYAEMIPAFVGDKVTETGTILFPAGEGKASWTLREELAEAAANILMTNGHEDKTYTLTNTESIGFNSIAQYMSETLGIKVLYKSLEGDEFKATLMKTGVQEKYIDMLKMWGAALEQQTMDKQDDTLSKILNRKPTQIKKFIERNYSQKQILK